MIVRRRKDTGDPRKVLGTTVQEPYET
jgi:hypothetical protein